MIETVSQFLEEFKAKGIRLIKEQDGDIRHTVTIGNIYEGLTSQMLAQTVFKGLDLNIVNNSFIFNDSGFLSSEMDCMIVVGKGKQIAFTNQFKYHIKDVIAVVQVKKKLYKDAIDDAHHNLKSVINTAEPRDGEAYMGRIQYDAYKALMKKVPPRRETVNNLSWREQMLYNYTLMQSFWPLRILIGYDSYKTEYALREGFVDHLESLTIDGPKSGYGPLSFPDLMLCGNNTIIKNIGMPFAFPFDLKKEFYWELFLSSPEKPMYYLLELIWTRLSYKFNLSTEIFGDDFHLDALHPFISCKERHLNDDNYAWEYSYHSLSEDVLNRQLNPLPWQPVELEIFEQAIIFRLIKTGKISCDKELEDFCKENNNTLQALIDKWVYHRVAYLENNELILLLDQPVMTSTGDGKIYLGENRSGEMSNWLSKLAKK